MAKRNCLQSLYNFFSKTSRAVHEDGTLSPTVPVVETRVVGTRLISSLAKQFQSKGLLVNGFFYRSFIHSSPFFSRF